MKLEQDGNKRIFTCFGNAIGKRVRSMNSRFDFAVVEALRRELLDGHFYCASVGNNHATRHRVEFLR